MIAALSHSEAARTTSLKPGSSPTPSSSPPAPRADTSELSRSGRISSTGSMSATTSRRRWSALRRVESMVSGRRISSSPSAEPPSLPRSSTMPLSPSPAATTSSPISSGVASSGMDDFWRYFQDASQLSFVMGAASSGQYSVIGLFEARSLLANFRSVDVSLVNRDDRGLKYIRGRSVAELRRFFGDTDFNSKSGLQIIHDLTLGGDISLSEEDRSVLGSAVKRRTQLLQIQRQKMDEHMRFHSPRDIPSVMLESSDDPRSSTVALSGSSKAATTTRSSISHRRTSTKRRSQTVGAKGDSSAASVRPTATSATTSSFVVPPLPMIPAVLTTSPLPTASKLSLAPPSSVAKSPSYSPMLSPLTPLVWSGDTPDGGAGESSLMTGHFPSITPLTGVMSHSPSDSTAMAAAMASSSKTSSSKRSSANAPSSGGRRSRKTSQLSDQITAAMRAAESVAVAMSSGLPPSILAKRVSAKAGLVAEKSSPNSSPIASAGFVTLDTPVSASQMSPRLSAVEEFDGLEISVSDGHSSAKSAVYHEDGVLMDYVQYQGQHHDHYQQSASLSREYTVFSALSGTWETSRSGSLSVPRPPRSAGKRAYNDGAAKHLRITPIHSGTSTGSFSSTARTMSISSNWTLEEKEMHPSQPTLESPMLTAFKFPRYDTVLTEKEGDTEDEGLETPIDDELDYPVSAPMTRRRGATDPTGGSSSGYSSSTTTTTTRTGRSWRMSESSTSRPTTQGSRHSGSHSRMATVVKSLELLESEDASDLLLGYSTDEGDDDAAMTDLSSSLMPGCDHAGLPMASIPESSKSSSEDGSFFSAHSSTVSAVKSSVIYDEDEEYDDDGDDEHKSVASEIDSSPMLTEHSSLSTSGMRTPVPTTPFKPGSRGSGGSGNGADSNYSGGYTAGFGVIHRDSAGFNFRPGRSALSEEESPSLDVSPTLVLARIESGHRKKKRESKRLSSKIRSKALKKVRSAGEVLSKKTKQRKSRVSRAAAAAAAASIVIPESGPPLPVEKTGLRLCYSARGTAGERPMDEESRPKPLDLTWRLASLMQAPIGI